MPSRATVKGVLHDINNGPVMGGKIIATMVGSDAFENGIRLAGRKLDTTTAEDGSWSLPLIVNGEGRHGSSSWTIEAYDNALTPVYKVEGLFILTSADIRLDDLEGASAANKAAAGAANMSRILAADSLDDYLAIPEGQRRDSDIVLRKVV